MKTGKIVGIIIFLLVVIGGVIGGTIAYQDFKEKKLKEEINIARINMYNDYVNYQNQLSFMKDKVTLEYSPETENDFIYMIEKIEETQSLVATAKWCNTRDMSFNNECDRFKDVATDYLIKLKKLMSANLDYIRGQDSVKDGEILLEKLRVTSEAKEKLDTELGKIKSRTDYYE